jgi:hypothetical protein
VTTVSAAIAGDHAKTQIKMVPRRLVRRIRILAA